ALRSTTLQALNVPLRQRVGELESALNAMRWLHCIKQEQHVAIVNLPSASLLLYEHGNLVLTSRLIVGKQSTPTPTLSSTITEVILYPYWNVPYKIATRELLPIIKRNRGYLAANNYQVLNSSGKVVNPENINWHSLGPSNFPYTIRQSTGCDNALGLVKLNFYNPFSVYLHDTPNKFLFSMNKRYFSHGCMRLEKAMELGRYIMRGNTLALDTLSEKGCLRNQAPITVPATEKIPVFVLYHTAWINAGGELRFYEDVYRKIK
ncbi:MAG TPA: L,D-transpeptidase family protein, partial [Ferruginibacter sp.]|nr:L,D-transpeptidase family protein [Ferruginibacter sp.]